MLAGVLSENYAALRDSESSGRSVFAFFSGGELDEKSYEFRSELLDTDEFKMFAKDKYVLLNLDLSSAEQVVARYGLSSYPTVYILSKDGYVLSIIQYNEAINSVSVLEDILWEQTEGINRVSGAIEKVQSSSGVEKVRSIDSLYEATPVAGRKILAQLVKQVPLLDPDNASGLVGKYEFISVYDEAIEAISEGRQDGVVESFVNIAENGHLDPAQTFEAYYNAAYLMALFASDDYDRMLDFLRKAMEADNENVRADDVTSLMNTVSQMRDIVSADLVD